MDLLPLVMTSPLAIIGLLVLVIFLLVWGQLTQRRRMGTLTGNHLHELPEMAQTLRSIKEAMDRQELANGQILGHLIYLRARMNGSDR